MNILRVLRQHSNFLYAFIILLGIINSLLSSGILFFINHAVAQTPIPYFPQYDWLLFTIILCVSLVFNRLFQKRMIRLTNSILYNFELSVLEKLKAAPYESFEKLGAERVYTAINDTRVLAQIPQSFINAINSFIIVTCSLAYMFWVSPAGGMTVVVLMISLAVFYMYRNKKIEKDLNTLRDMQNDYHRYLRDLLMGFREVRISTTRRENIFGKFLNKTLSNSLELGITNATRGMNNELVGSYSWYVVLGVILFALPRLIQLNFSQTTSFIVIVLFIMGPVSMLISLIPFYTRIKISLQRLDGLERQINAYIPPSMLEADAVAEPLPALFEQISFNDVCYHYTDHKKQTLFKLGPLNLTLGKGEVIFVTGGNGSGKSTFVNLVTGLYQPTDGSISYNDQPVTPETQAAYSDKISVIFSNNHLFKENYDDFDLKALNQRLSGYIDTMKLSAVVRFEEDKNHIDNNLSKGQQKRLALIYAFLEDKEVLVLDEWAAEQDPSFRKYFYTVIIPALKERGKTIIAVTHDDAYYHCADRIVRFDYGNIILDQMIQKEVHQED
jgi:cyclic peptide transporter